MIKLKNILNEAPQNEAKVKTPTEILTSVPATAIPPTNIPKADVALGLHMGGVLGKYPTILLKHFGIELRKLGKITDSQLNQLINKEGIKTIWQETDFVLKIFNKQKK